MGTVHSRRQRHAALSRLTKVAVVTVIAAAMLGCPSIVNPPGGDFIPGPGSPIAPGLNITIQQVAIPLDLRPEVKFAATDDQGNRIPMAELADARFILAYLEDPDEGSTAKFVSYNIRTETAKGAVVQATYDGARLDGVTENADGSYTYKFADTVPASYDRSATHQLGGQFEREAIVDEELYVANPIFTFRPDGRSVNETREIVTTATCNECHTRMQFHGERREVQLCILCHTPQSTDAQSGNTVDFATMIHKIHRGEDLPSVQDGDPYFIVGFRNTVHDYSDVVFPQDVRNCTVCHTDAPDAHVYKEMPTLSGCASCHDRTWFGDPDQTPEGFANHVGGMHMDNSLCAVCHTPDAPGASPVTVAHVLPTESASAPGLALDITAVNAAKGEAGDMITLDFTAVDKNGNPYTDLSQLGTVAATIGWPAPEFEQNVREQISGTPSGNLVNNGGGSYSYTFAAQFPTTPGLTFAAAMEGRVPFMFRGQSMNQGTSTNGYTIFTTDGSDPEPRRDIIEAEDCNKCHKEMRFHGELRVGVEYCVMCHNVNGTDASRRPMDALPPETINFKDMIHQIHRGEDLQGDYTVYGFGGVAHDFTHVRFPGLLQECSICHTDDSTELPLPAEALSTMITQDQAVISDVLPERAACVTCHDNTFANVHAIINTDVDMRVESCVVCHGPNAESAVSQVHELEP